MLRTLISFMILLPVLVIGLLAGLPVYQSIIIAGTGDITNVSSGAAALSILNIWPLLVVASVLVAAIMIAVKFIRRDQRQRMVSF